MKRRKGLIRVSYSLIKELLSLPDDTNIVSVFLDDYTDGQFYIGVESPNIGMVEEGATVPVITIQQLSGYDE